MSIKIGIETINDEISSIRINNTFIKLTNIRRIIRSLLKKSNKLDKEFFDIIKKAKSITEKENADFYFVYLPEFYRYNLKYNDKNRKKIISQLLNDNINVVDIHSELFAKESDPTDFFPNNSAGHYNELGYKKIAEYLLERIN